MWHIYPYSSGLLHWHCDNNTIVLCKYSEGYGAKSTSQNHCNDVIMSAVASQITSVSIVCLAVGSGADQWKHQSSASLSFVRGIHRSLVNSAHKRPVTRKMFPFDDVIMKKPQQSTTTCVCIGPENHWAYRKLSLWQTSQPSVRKKQSSCRYFRWEGMYSQCYVAVYYLT